MMGARAENLGPSCRVSSVKTVALHVILFYVDHMTICLTPRRRTFRPLDLQGPLALARVAYKAAGLCGAAASRPQVEFTIFPLQQISSKPEVIWPRALLLIFALMAWMRQRTCSTYVGFRLGTGAFSACPHSYDQAAASPGKVMGAAAQDDASAFWPSRHRLSW